MPRLSLFAVLSLVLIVMSSGEPMARASAPSISTPPSIIIDRTQETVEDAIFSVSELGNDPSVTWRWYKNGQLIRGATSATLTVRAPTAAQAGRYTVMASNPEGRATTFCDLVVITRHTDRDLVLNEGAAMKLTASGVYGSAVLTWVNQGTPAREIEGMRGTSSLTLTGPAMAGTWEMRVSTADVSGGLPVATYNVTVLPRPKVRPGALHDFAMPMLEFWNLALKDLFVGDDADTRFSATGLPPGMILERYGYEPPLVPFPIPEQWWLAGQPVQPGVYHPVITARGPGGAASVRVTLRISGLPAGMAGTYAGAVTPASNLPLGGKLRFTLADNGILSGEIRLGTGVNRFVARLEPNATPWLPYTHTYPARWTLAAVDNIPQRIVSLKAEATSTGSGGYLFAFTGSITEGTSVPPVSFTATRLMREVQLPRLPQSGLFHLVIHEEEESNVCASAILTWSGSSSAAHIFLADGTEFACSGDLVSGSEPLLEERNWVLVVHSPLYQKTGAFTGLIGPYTSGATWVRPSASQAPTSPYAGRFYPEGFSMALSSMGSSYRAPRSGDGPMFFDPPWLAPLETPGNAIIDFTPAPGNDYRRGVLQVAANGTCNVPGWSRNDPRYNTVKVHRLHLTPATGMIDGELSIFDPDPNDSSRQIERRVQVRGYSAAACVISALPAAGAPQDALPSIDFAAMFLSPFNAATQ